MARRASARLLVAGLLVASVTATGSVDPVAAGPKQESRDGPRMTAIRRGNQIEYHHKTKLPKAKTKQHKGQRLSGGGCSYSAKGILGRDAEMYVERETRQDLDGCVMTVEWASLTETEAEAAGYHAESHPHAKEGEVLGEDSYSPDPTRTESHSGFAHKGCTKTYYDEPAYGDVATVEAHLGWTFNGSCVTSWGAHTYWHVLNETGWTDVAHRSDWPGAGCQKTVGKYGKFKNGVFCATNDTFVEYNTTRFTGFGDGRAGWAWNSNKWGGCNWFLSYHAEVYKNGERIY